MAKACLGGYKSPEGPQEIDLNTEMAQKESEKFHCNQQQQQQQTNNSALQETKEPPPRSKLGTSPNCNRHILGDIERKPPNNSVKNEDATNHIPIKEDPQVARNENDAGNRANSTSTINSSSKKSSSNNNFRASSQQFLHKKSWKKQFKARHQKSNQKPQQHQQISKADMENIQNIKNQIKHHNKQQQHAQKNAKQIFNKKLLHRSAPFAIRSKFFLPDKRPRKEVIIPPTKFLLGGNISDPLNLNSLQDEALNATPTPTPKQSPITTPPKVEVIIPPNIHDPLHLLDPVDSVEYEKLLVSPMKRKSKSKHRNRKKKPKKRKRLGSSVCIEPPVVATEGQPITVLVPSNASATAASASSIISKCSNNSAFSSDTSTSVIDKVTGDVYTGEGNKPAEPQSSGLDSSNNNNNGSNITLCPASDTSQSSSCIVGSTQKANLDSAQKPNTSGGGGGGSALAGRRNSDREKVSRDLRLDLASAIELQQQNAAGSGAGRKRKISEGPNSVKNKFRRLDSMDKIVSPVIPQPGAWKRPPRTVPSGARKMSRVRSTSVSETDLISPTDEIKTLESESVRGDTPDVESISKPDETTEIPLPIFDKKPKFRPEGAKYQYGNYNRYPGYRYLSEKMDVRLQVFQRNAQLFRRKDVLDIGCNVGHITIAVAKDLAPKSILGIDIDKDLIYRARKNLSMYVRIPKDEEADSGTVPGPSNSSEKGNNNASSTNQESKSSEAETSSKLMHKTDTSKAREVTAAIKAKKIHHRRKTLSKLREEDKTEFFPVSFPMSLGRIPNFVGGKMNPTSPPSTSPAADNNSLKSEFPENVFFRTQNYVLPDEALLNNDTQQYDLILCLSVTKWIHLNFGDAGLKLAFKRMFNQLRPGGKLILEAQNWASYKKKKNLTETIYNNYRNIEFFPNKFHEYLLSNEVGFSHSYTMGVPRHVSKGFCRPIQLYAKGDFTPSHIRWSDTYYPQTPYEAYRGIYASMPRPPYNPWGSTPHGSNSGPYSCRQTPMHQPTSQYYNPLETDSYLPSYDTEVLNRHYVFASPLYQTVWSPPASLRNSSTHTPVFGSVRDCDLEDGVCTARHVYPPNEECSSPQVSSGAFNSIREADSEDCSQDQQQRRHVYASCEGSSSPKADSFVESSPDAGRQQQQQQQHQHHPQEHVESIEMDPGPGEDSGGGGGDVES